MPSSQRVGIWTVAVCLSVCLFADAAAPETGKVLSDLEAVSSKARESLQRHGSDAAAGRGDAPGGEGDGELKAMVEGVISKLRNENRSALTEETELRTAEAKCLSLVRDVQRLQDDTQAKATTLVSMMSLVEEEKQHIRRIEKDLDRVQKQRNKHTENRQLLRTNIEVLQRKVQATESTITELSDAQMEKWLKGRIAAIGTYLNSDDTSLVLSDMLEEARVAYMESSASIDQLSQRIDAKTGAGHSILRLLVTCCIYAAPPVVVYLLRRRFSRVVNLRGGILLGHLMVLSFITASFVVSMLRIDVSKLQDAVTRQLFYVELITDAVIPLLSILVFLAGALGTSAREKLCYALQFVMLMVVVTAIIELSPTHHLSMHRYTYRDPRILLGGIAIFCTNIVLTIYARRVQPGEALASGVQNMLRGLAETLPKDKSTRMSTTPATATDPEQPTPIPSDSTETRAEATSDKVD